MNKLASIGGGRGGRSRVVERRLNESSKLAGSCGSVAESAAAAARGQLSVEAGGLQRQWAD